MKVKLKKIQVCSELRRTAPFFWGVFARSFVRLLVLMLIRMV